MHDNQSSTGFKPKNGISLKPDFANKFTPFLYHSELSKNTPLFSVHALFSVLACSPSRFVFVLNLLEKFVLGDCFDKEQNRNGHVAILAQVAFWPKSIF